MSEIQFYNRDLETIDRKQLREWQNERLRALMAELATNEFYQAKAQAAGHKLEDIKGIEDLCALPFTEKSELVEEQTTRLPFGRLLTYPLNDYRYFHQT